MIKDKVVQLIRHRIEVLSRDMSEDTAAAVMCDTPSDMISWAQTAAESFAVVQELRELINEVQGLEQKETPDYLKNVCFTDS